MYGIYIIKYLHNDNAHNGGNGEYMSPLCATVEGVYCGATRHAIELRGGISMLCIGHWAW